MSNTFNSILERLGTLQKLMNLTDEQVKLLATHKKVSAAELEVGEQKYPAWRIVHNDALGPGKGGIRFHPEVSEDEIKCLSFWMSLKNALVGLPFGGAKGGVRFYPKSASEQELESISRAYIGAFYQELGENKDIPAPDVYTNEQIMAWMLDEYEKKVGRHEPGMITGKPVGLGGLSLRQEATARGGFIGIKQMLASLNRSEDSLTVAIQGFGHVGSNLAKMLSDANFLVVAVSDSQAGVYNEQGMDMTRMIVVKQKQGSVSEYADGEKITNQDLLELDVDLLILAALENQITGENAERVKAKTIVELANGPVTPDADKILFNKNIVLVPDILANAGGVVASYFEWTQNRTGGICPLEQLESRLELMMKHSWNRVYERYQVRERQLDLRTCAWLAAIEKILEAEKWRGNTR